MKIQNSEVRQNMRIAEKKINFHFQWKRDSPRAYSYTPSPTRTLYGKPLTLYLMYSFMYPKKLNIEYTKPTTFFILLVTPQKKSRSYGTVILK